MNQLWNDDNRYNQTGYSSPTVFPQPENYINKALWIEDSAMAERREISRQEWLEDEAYEARMEYREQQAEAKAEREEWQ